MKVKVGDTIYDGEHVPVMAILSDDDKRNIANMSPECTKYAAFPDGSPQVEIERWMKDEPNMVDKSKPVVMGKINAFIQGNIVCLSDEYGDVVIEGRDELLKTIKELTELAAQMPISIEPEPKGERI
jgi:hypothetical protein